MSDFATLKARVQELTVDLPAVVLARIPAYVNNALREAAGQHNFRAMEAKASFTTTEGAHLLGNLPTNWKGRRDRPFIRLGEGGVEHTLPIDWASDEDDIVEAYSVDDPKDKGEPEVLFERINETTGIGGTLEVYPFPDLNSRWTDGNYRISVPYWKYMTPFSLDTDVNWFTENMEDYLVYRATSDAYGLNWDDERAILYMQKATIEMTRGKALDKRSRFPLNPTLVPRDGPFMPRLSRRRIY